MVIESGMIWSIGGYLLVYSIKKIHFPWLITVTNFPPPPLSLTLSLYLKSILRKRKFDASSVDVGKVSKALGFLEWFPPGDGSPRDGLDLDLSHESVNSYGPLSLLFFPFDRQSLHARSIPSYDVASEP